MKSVLCGALLLALAIVVPLPTMAQVGITVNIPLPPAMTFAAPPNVVVLPDTNDVYVVPGVAVDLFFVNGWWWRFWEGRWYRSHYYDRGWGYYQRVPRFYFDVDPNWRASYRDHTWNGHRWNYEPIPNRQLQQNWKSWHSTQHWAKQGTWGVQGYQPRSPQQRQALQQQRQHEYQQRPEVQQHQPRPAAQPRAQQRGPQGPQARQPQENVRPEQRPEPRPQGQPQHPQREGKPERGEEEPHK